VSKVRIGILGAARIAPNAVVKPAAHNPEAEIVAVAARQKPRAEAFATKHSIARVGDSYQALLDDQQVDAIYNPLPNGLHAEWTVKAVNAGKHVLCEKPFASNAEEAERVAAISDPSGLVVMEAFHYRYHPMAKRAVQIIQDGQLGRIHRVETAFCFPLPRFSDIRYQLDLAGGAMMDAGCYAVHMARTLGGSEPQVTRATAKLRSAGVDRAMTADLVFPEGHTGSVTASMWSSSVLRISARVWGEKGSLSMVNPLAPQMWHRLAVTIDGKRRVEKFSRRPTYAYQLDAFCDAVLRQTPTLTPTSDAVANMRVIDAVYQAAGLQPRPSSM
jgi:predicted dehydrogenase